MLNPEKEPDLNDVPRDILMNYYSHQYERMGKLEDARMAITNIAVSLSLLAFTFGFDKDMQSSKEIGYALLIAVTVANGFAIAYILITKSWIATFKQRAKEILELTAKPLFLFDKRTDSKQSTSIFKLWRIHVWLHGLLIAVAAVVAFLLV